MIEKKNLEDSSSPQVLSPGLLSRKNKISSRVNNYLNGLMWTVSTHLYTHRDLTILPLKLQGMDSKSKSKKKNI